MREGESFNDDENKKRHECPAAVERGRRPEAPKRRHSDLSSR